MLKYCWGIYDDDDDDDDDDELRERFHLAHFPTCKKELKKILESSLVGHTFNLCTLKEEAARYLSLSLAWSTE